MTRRNRDLKRRYNITAAEYDMMLISQNHTCKICKDVCTTGRRLSVDHCHSTGAIRGLLCTNCNSGLGKFKDNPQLLAAAIKYLEDK